MTSFFKSLMLIVSLILISGCALQTQVDEQWEYKRIVIDPLDNKGVFQIAQEGITAEELLEQYHQKLNELGKEGWELVSTSPDTKVHFFKRRL